MKLKTFANQRSEAGIRRQAEQVRRLEKELAEARLGLQKWQDAVGSLDEA